MSKIAISTGLLLVLLLGCTPKVNASLTKEQGEDVATFATSFISEGNKRRDENGYPLLVYALASSTNGSIGIRRSGYNSELYYLNNNNYHRKNGKYLDLGYKWTMDCGDFVAYVYHQLFGMDLMLPNSDPWHCIDMYNDANKYQNSTFFEFIYKNVPISKLDEAKLEKGDIVLKIGPGDNHAVLYVDEGFRCAHASRNGIKYGLNPPILGFEELILNRFYKTSTIVSIVRVKDGVISSDAVANGIITWPDTGEVADLLPDQPSKKLAMQELIEPILIYSGDNIVVYYENTPSGEVVEVISSGENHEKLELADNSVDSSELSPVFNYLERNGLYIEKNMQEWISSELKKFLLELENISKIDKA